VPTRDIEHSTRSKEKAAEGGPQFASWAIYEGFPGCLPVFRLSSASNSRLTVASFEFEVPVEQMLARPHLLNLPTNDGLSIVSATIVEAIGPSRSSQTLLLQRDRLTLQSIPSNSACPPRFP
jgi:hypothetical protein